MTVRYEEQVHFSFRLDLKQLTKVNHSYQTLKQYSL